MVVPNAVAFLDAYWDDWWQSHGINLTISPADADRANAAIDKRWEKHAPLIETHCRHDVDAEGECIHLQPHSQITFLHPWDGEYYT